MQKHGMKPTFDHIRFVTMFGDLICMCVNYFSHMTMTNVSTPEGRYGVGTSPFPQHYHRVVSLGAWLGLLAGGGLCWALILSSI